MDASMIEAVRSFNRTVTQRVGALSDQYLARQRPLGEARVLWEIGVGGCEVRLLRSRLGLDSGYLSRLLRSLEASGLVSVTPGERDRRVRTVWLTTKGKKERALLDRRSDALALSMLAPLADDRRERLVAAMTEVERLLTVSLVELVVVDPSHPDAQYCLCEYFAELDHRFDSGFDPSQSLPAGNSDMRLPAGLFMVATLRGEPVGCGALMFHGGQRTDLKRMWVLPSARGLGVGRRLLEALEHEAVARHSPRIRLETNHTLTEAIALYRSAGYDEVEAFNDERYADQWFEKPLR
jgi:DNA-binding MarR family transcriptional regulator/GNAT superfamily N-acetyltransferase